MIILLINAVVPDTVNELFIAVVVFNVVVPDTFKFMLISNALDIVLSPDVNAFALSVLPLETSPLTSRTSTATDKSRIYCYSRKCKLSTIRWIFFCIIIDT